MRLWTLKSKKLPWTGLKRLIRSFSSSGVPQFSVSSEEDSNCPTPSEVLRSRIKSGELSEDAHQVKVTEELGRLHEELLCFQPSDYVDDAGVFSSLSKVVFGEEPRRKKLERVPRGLYLWGTVGGGKTMLMDLFFDGLTEGPSAQKKARLHYHDLMQEVHALMHEAKINAPPRDHHRWDEQQPFDPIPPVGDALLRRGHLFCLDEFQVRICHFFPRGPIYFIKRGQDCKGSTQRPTPIESMAYTDSVIYT